MAVIVLARHYGAGGSVVAEAVAASLGWTLVDNAFIDLVAERVGLSAGEVADREEMTPSLIDRLARSLAVTTPDVFVAAATTPAATSDEIERRLVQVTEAVIDEAVDAGDTVIVGRGAHAYLAGRSATLHVFVTAPRQARVARAAEELGVDLDEAARVTGVKDRQRERYARINYDRDWLDPVNYHLVVNTGLLGLEGAASVVVSAARERLGPGIGS